MPSESAIWRNFYLSGAQDQYQIVYPKSTILIENPVALVDTYVDKHGTREVAQAFIDYLWSPEAQQAFANHGFRPVNEDVAKTVHLNEDVTADDALTVGTIAITFPKVEDQFSIADEFTTWSDARTTFFGDEGSITQLITTIKGG